MTEKEIQEITKYCSIPYAETRETVNVNKSTNVCKKCGKRYGFPSYIFKPRDLICATCESEIRIKITMGVRWYI